MKKIDTILDEMLAKTREMPSDNQVPYAFEKRIMAHIKEAPEPAANPWELWGHSLWRALVPCLAILVLAAVWMKAPGETTGTTSPKADAPTVATIDSPADENLESLVIHAIDLQLDK